MSMAMSMDAPRKPCVLIVDDALTVRAYSRQILEEGGFQVIEAVNGMEGLERALADQPDLLLVDVNMPKMDGYSMLQQIRSQPELHDIPAVMISTEAADEDRQRALMAGANWYVVKPVRPQTLITAARLLTGQTLTGQMGASPGLERPDGRR